VTTAAIIVAAGRGQRFGGDVPKQYRRVGGQMILTRSINALLASDSIAQLCVVIHEDDQPLYKEAVAPISDSRIRPCVLGSTTRAKSVRAGLESLMGLSPAKVLIHDAARPFVDTRIIEELLRALDKSSGAFPTIPVSDALWRSADLAPVDRAGLVRAQTPQAFNYPDILRAHSNGDPDARDDVAIAVSVGLDVAQVAGDERNFKVTTSDDLARAQAQVSSDLDIRVGQGYDVHAFTEGGSVTLNGIEIPHTHCLKGHSDADVAMHAITDAIYGALAEGDIGQWFPPSDAKWKGAASDIFLKHAVSRAAERGFQISHVDCTIVCEEPKIGPHAVAMKENLRTILGIAIDRISVKATTSEKLGFTGRAEGISAHATATLMRS